MRRNLAAISMFLVPPDSGYASYIDFRTLVILILSHGHHGWAAKSGPIPMDSPNHARQGKTRLAAASWCCSASFPACLSKATIHFQKFVKGLKPIILFRKHQSIFPPNFFQWPLHPNVPVIPSNPTISLWIGLTVTSM